jgi:hypothetical protein
MKDKPTQKTPTGYEIPIPKRSAFDRLIKKAANTPVPDSEKPLRRSPRRTKK